MRRLLFLAVLLLAEPAWSAPVGATWYRDANCTQPEQNTTVGTSSGKSVLYYCPADGNDSSDVTIRGVIADVTWVGDTQTPPGSVTINVYKGCPSSASSTGCVDPFSDSTTAPYQVMTPGTASASGTLGPGRYRFHPSSSAANGRLELRGN